MPGDGEQASRENVVHWRVESIKVEVAVEVTAQKRQPPIQMRNFIPLNRIVRQVKQQNYGEDHSKDQKSQSPLVKSTPQPL